MKYLFAITQGCARGAAGLLPKCDRMLALYFVLLSALVTGIVGCSHHDRDDINYTYYPGNAVSFSVTPGSASLTPGMSLQLSALIAYESGTEKDVTAQAAWSVSDAEIASVDGGLVTALSPGSVTVTATTGDFSGKAVIQVINAAPTGYTVVSSSGIVDGEISVINGIDEPLHVYAALDDGSTIEITDTVIWESSNPEVAYVSADGVICTEAAGQTTIVGKTPDGEIIAEFTVDVPEAQLVSITLNKTELDLIAGYSDSLSAMASFDNGQSFCIDEKADWSSSNSGVAKVAIAKGTVKINGLKKGTASIEVSYQGQTAKCQVSVADAKLVSLSFDQGKEVQLAKGLTADISVTGGFSDGSSRDVTSDVTLTSDNNKIVSVKSAVLTASAPGSAVVTAEKDGIKTELTVTVSDAVITALALEGEDTVIAGYSISLSAVAELSDGTTGVAVTPETWLSSDTSIAMVTDGQVWGLAPGTVTITAKIGDVQADKDITVSDAVVTSLLLDGKDSVIAGRDIALKAIAGLSDGTAGVEVTPESWSSSDPTIATVADGQVQGLKPGTVTITAKIGDVQAEKEITVNEAVITALTIEGGNTVIAGESINLTALGDFSDGTVGEDVTSDVLWSSSDTETALVTEGLVRTLKSGTVTVTAKIGDVQATKDITISEAVLTSLKVVSKRTTLAIGHEGYLSLVAGYSDGSISTDVTADEWRTSDARVAKVEDGVVTGLNPGKVTITAVLGGMEANSKEITIFSQIDELVIEADSSVVYLGDTMQLRLLARYKDGKSSHVTDDCEWSSENEEFATVSDTGVVTGVKIGNATIKAVFEGAEATLDIEITATPVVVERVADYVVGEWVLDEENILYKLGYYDSVKTISSTSYQLYKNGAKVTELVIPETEEYDGHCYIITGIGVDAFKKCTSLTSVTIPDSVTSVDENAFLECTGLTAITIPDSVTYLGEYVFRDCTNLKEAIIGNGVPELKSNVFKNCSKLSTVSIGSSVAAMGNQVFYHCTSLTKVELPEGMELIDTGVFWGCTKLELVCTKSDTENTKLPDGVTFIGENAFNGCSKIERLDIPDGAVTIGNNAFKNVQHIYYDGTASGRPWGAGAIN